MTKTLVALAVLLAAISLSVAYTPAAQADGEGIEITSTSVISEFPTGIRFKLEADSDVEIATVAVRFRTGQQARGAYDYLEFEQTGELIDSELFWRTNTGGRYIPPGTILTYNFEIEDTEGNRFDTDKQEFIYLDPRFEWSEVTDGPITVAYHGPVRSRAESVLEAMVITLNNMGPVLGADVSQTIRATMYNNNREMLEALPPGSTTIRRELITEGQAFVDIGTLLLLGSGRGARGTAAHEMTHILTHRAGDSVFRNVPQWLDEGLAEYGNIEPGFSYDIALEFALATDTLLPITSMPALPGNPQDVIIFYGQSSSIVRFMIGAFGVDKMGELMSELQSGKDVDEAIPDVYGVERIELENFWRDFIGAPLRSVDDRERLVPTAVPRAEILPYSLTPQAQGQEVAGSEAEPTSTPSPVPTATEVPEPTATAVPEPVAAAPAPTEIAISTQSGNSESSETTEMSGGGCNAPIQGTNPGMELSSIGLLVGLAGLGLRRRVRR